MVRAGLLDREGVRYAVCKILYDDSSNFLFSCQPQTSFLIHRFIFVCAFFQFLVYTRYVTGVTGGLVGGPRAYIKINFVG